MGLRELSSLLAVACLSCMLTDRPPTAPEMLIAPGIGALQSGPLLVREGDVFRLDGEAISPFGLRAANVLQSDQIAARFVDALDVLRAHGMQSVAITIQGGRHTEGGNSAFNGFRRDGSLDPVIAHRLAWILNETATRHMVPVITLFYRGRDQELESADAVRAAVVHTLEFLAPWRHAWVHLINEPNHPGYDHALLTTPEGRIELYRLAKRTDPERIVSVGPEAGANDGFLVDTWGRLPELEPPAGGDVSIEYVRGESYRTPGVFDDAYRSQARRDAEAAARAGGYWFWHAAWHQKADAEGWPRFDKGGTGAADDPGTAFVWDLLRELAQRPDGEEPTDGDDPTDGEERPEREAWPDPEERRGSLPRGIR